jgi:hypothetical protein
MSNRPRFHDQTVIAEIARKLMPRLLRWAEDWVKPAELEAELIDTLQRAAPLFDAYDMAKYMESKHGWSSDADLVDILDDAEMEAYSIRQTKVEEWVASNAIRPKKAIGDVVRVNAGAANGLLAQADGEIVSIDEQRATYTVMVAELGHVRTGVGTHGLVLPYEQFHELATPPEEFVLSPQ